MFLTMKYMLMPSRAKRDRLAALVEDQRVRCNAALEERIDCYRKTGKTLARYDQFKALTECRRDIPEMRDVPAQLQRGTLRRLDESFKGYFRRIRNGERPGIAGAEYQQGTLAGFEVREYLLEKWGRKCAYCCATGTPLQIDHVRPKAAGGSDRVSNLTLACPSYNQAKRSRSVEGFLARRPGRLRRVLDGAAVNATRRVLFEGLERTGLPVSGHSGKLTKFNRARLGVPKSHTLDAACVGETSALKGWSQPVLGIMAMGRGSYSRARVDRSGFPVGHLKAGISVRGFWTGDIVRAVVPPGQRQGVHSGRVAVRASGSFNVQTPSGTVQGVSHRHCRIVQRGDGYGYRLDTTRQKETATMHGTQGPAFLPDLKDGVSCGADR